MLPIVAVSILTLTVLAIIWSAGSTLGYDFAAYAGAARRLIDGQRLYDPAIDVAGGFAIYLYPPPFALAIVPLAWIGGQAAVWIWVSLMVAAFLAGVALMPVRPTVRWAVLLLAALDWPVLYSIKLGQVGPLLLLLFAMGWRAVGTPERPGPPGTQTILGASIGLGTIIKVQPAILLGWAVLTGRWRSIVVAIGVGIAAALAATLVAGTQPWFDYPALLGRVSSPLTTPHNFTPGAIAFQAGVPETIAAAIQWASVAATLLAVVVAARWRAGDASYLVAVVASQLISPLLWDHYAMLLLLPVAWLLERRQWWAVLIPLATSIVVVGIAPSAIYPVVFGACLLAPILVADRGSPLPRLDDPATGPAMTLDSAV
jgi:alpha-1,2-mannosyltransferase